MQIRSSEPYEEGDDLERRLEELVVGVAEPEVVLPRPDVRFPVNLRHVDPDEAKDRLSEPLHFASEIVDDVDAFEFEKLTRAAIDLILSREASRGAQVGRLAKLAKTGRGRLKEHVGGHWQDFTDLTIRGISAVAARRALYEELVSLPVRVGRRHNGLGTDRRNNAGNSLHLVTATPASSDRHCPAWVRPLLAGTRDDRTSARADLNRIEHWEHALGHPLPGNFAEAMEAALAQQQRIRLLVYHAIRKRRDAFSQTLTPRALFETFSEYLTIPRMPYGPPSAPHFRSAAQLLPGRDEQTIEAIRRSGRYGILYAGRPHGRAENPTSSSFEPFSIGPLPDTYNLGITRPPRVQWSWSEERKQLARETIGSGSRTELWRLVGDFSGERLLAAVARIERYAQNPLPGDCLERWERDTGPGLLQAHDPVVTWCCLDVLSVANAAVVDADRRAQVRHAHG
jgi:hypothetical protein